MAFIAFLIGMPLLISLAERGDKVRKHVKEFKEQQDRYNYYNNIN